MNKTLSNLQFRSEGKSPQHSKKKEQTELDRVSSSFFWGSAGLDASLKCLYTDAYIIGSKREKVEFGCSCRATILLWYKHTARVLQWMHLDGLGRQSELARNGSCILCERTVELHGVLPSVR